MAQFNRTMVYVYEGFGDKSRYLGHDKVIMSQSKLTDEITYPRLLSS